MPLVKPTYRSRTGNAQSVRRMINDVSTPATEPVQRSDAKLSKAYITRQPSSVSDRLRRIKRNIDDRYAVTSMSDKLVIGVSCRNSYVLLLPLSNRADSTILFSIKFERLSSILRNAIIKLHCILCKKVRFLNLR